MPKNVIDPEFAGITQSRVEQLTDATRLAAASNKDVAAEAVSPLYAGAARYGNNINNQKLHEQIAAAKLAAKGGTPAAPAAVPATRAPIPDGMPGGNPPAPAAPAAPPAWKQNA